MYKGFWLLSGLFLSFVSSADELHTNAFGDVFNDSTPFSVGHVDTSTEGRNAFGDIFVEGSPFAVGHIEGVTTEGVLYMDAFGDVYVTGSPFKVDAKSALNLKD